MSEQQKLVTFLVPAYNAEPYLDKCVTSLLKGGQSVEIIIIDDGSKDKTAEIADRYAAENPGVVQVVHQENGGHGAGINVGMEKATGLYFKVIDADDWVDEECLGKYLVQIKKFKDEGTLPDLIVTDFMFEHVDDGKQALKSYARIFKPEVMMTWNEIKFWQADDYLMIHGTTMRTKVLQDANFKLPHHRFYEDNLYVYRSLYYAKSIYYMPIPLYRYYVGREGQSINIHTMAKRYRQQLDNMTELVLAYQYDDIMKLEKKHRKTLIHMINIYSFLTLTFVSVDYNRDHYHEFKAYKREFKAKNPKLYRKIMYRTSYIIPNLLIRPLRIGSVKFGYKIFYHMTNWG